MNLFTCTDYRHYLIDYFTRLQKKNRSLSMREILRRIGTSSPSYFKEVVVDRKKKMSAAMARKFAAYMTLDKDESAFFAALVGYNQAENEIDRNHYYEELVRHQKCKTADNHFLTVREYDYLSSWEVSAVRELLLYYNTFGNRSNDERRQLADRFLPELTDEQVDKAIGILETLGFIEKDKMGNYRKTPDNIRAVKKTPVAYLVLRQNMRHALRIINRAAPGTRIFKNLTLSFSEQAYDILEVKIQEFCKEMIDIASRDALPADRIYALGIQLFPLTRLTAKG